MSRIIILAKSGFGKSTGTGPIPELGFMGLDPKESYIISATSKDLPYRGSRKLWPVTTIDNLPAGRRVITNIPADVAYVLTELLASPVKNIVLDDFNYLMQDWYMDNALRTGWDAPKQIGFDMGKVFKAIELYKDTPDKHIIVLAHGEEVPDKAGRIYMKLKTTGKMVDEYVTPEGKFDITLIGKSRWDAKEKKVIKEYITNEDQDYSSPKSPIGMFKELYIPNDLGPIVKTVNEYYNGE